MGLVLFKATKKTVNTSFSKRRLLAVITNAVFVVFISFGCMPRAMSQEIQQQIQPQLLASSPAKTSINQPQLIQAQVAKPQQSPLQPPLQQYPNQPQTQPPRSQSQPGAQPPQPQYQPPNIIQAQPQPGSQPTQPQVVAKPQQSPLQLPLQQYPNQPQTQPSRSQLQPGAQPPQPQYRPPNIIQVQLQSPSQLTNTKLGKPQPVQPQQTAYQPLPTEFQPQIQQQAKLLPQYYQSQSKAQAFQQKSPSPTQNIIQLQTQPQQKPSLTQPQMQPPQGGQSQVQVVQLYVQPQPAATQVCTPPPLPVAPPKVEPLPPPPPPKPVAKKPKQAPIIINKYIPAPCRKLCNEPKPETVGINPCSVKENNYQPYSEIGLGGVTYSNTDQAIKLLTSYDIFLPLSIPHNEAIFFTDLRIFDQSGSSFEGSAQFGYRYLLPHLNGLEQMVGIYGSLDRMRSNHKQYFNQLVFGGEYWRNNLFIGGNFYLPLGTRKKLVEETSGFRLYEAATSGVDGEIGYTMANGITGYVGGFYFNAKEAEKIKGISARLEYLFYQNSEKRLLGIFDSAKFVIGLKKFITQGTMGFLELKLGVGLGPCSRANLPRFNSHLVELIRKSPQLVVSVLQKKPPIINNEQNLPKNPTVPNPLPPLVPQDKQQPPSESAPTLPPDNKLPPENTPPSPIPPSSSSDTTPIVPPVNEVPPQSPLTNAPPLEGHPTPPPANIIPPPAVPPAIIPDNGVPPPAAPVPPQAVPADVPAPEPPVEAGLPRWVTPAVVAAAVPVAAVGLYRHGNQVLHAVQRGVESVGDTMIGKHIRRISGAARAIIEDIREGRYRLRYVPSTEHAREEGIELREFTPIRDARMGNVYTGAPYRMDNETEGREIPYINPQVADRFQPSQRSGREQPPQAAASPIAAHQVVGIPRRGGVNVAQEHNETTPARPIVFGAPSLQTSPRVEAGEQ